MNAHAEFSQLTKSNHTPGGKRTFHGSESHMFLDDTHRIAITFSYNERSIGEIKKIPGHRWHPEEKRWSVPLTNENVELLLKLFENDNVQIAPEVRVKLHTLNESVEGDLKELRRLMRLQNYSNKTIKAYLSYIRTFAKSFHPRNPRQLSEGDIREYLIQLSESGNYAASTINQIFNALRFLYVDFYNMSYAIGSIPRPRRERKLPDILNEDELDKLFSAIKNPKHRLLIRLIYSGGFRVSEAVRLRLEDVDKERGLIHIRGGRGRKIEQRYSRRSSLRSYESM